MENLDALGSGDYISGKNRAGGGSFMAVVEEAIRGIGLRILGVIVAAASIIGIFRLGVAIVAALARIRKKTKPAPNADSEAPQ